jgi:hypothetical protein
MSKFMFMVFRVIMACQIPVITYGALDSAMDMSDDLLTKWPADGGVAHEHHVPGRGHGLDELGEVITRGYFAGIRCPCELPLWFFVEICESGGRERIICGKIPAVDDLFQG